MRYGPNDSRKPITPPIIRFRAKIEKTAQGCWEWRGFIGDKGYGTFFDGQQMQQAHRWSYMHYVGAIPDGLVIDHLCRNRCCVNPAHLEPVTNQENCLRGNTGIYFRPKKTHCKKGHALSGGGGKCDLCAKERYRAWYESTKSEWLPLFNARRRERRAAIKQLKGR